MVIEIISQATGIYYPSSIIIILQPILLTRVKLGRDFMDANSFILKCFSQEFFDILVQHFMLCFFFSFVNHTLGCSISNPYFLQITELLNMNIKK